MMKLVFENATIRDSITKAARVAPTRGNAFDKAAGILISVVDGQVSLRATDMEIFYHEVVDAVSVEGDGEWRLPSILLGGFFGKIPIGSGKQLTMVQEGTVVVASTGRARGKFRMIPAEYFPTWEPFDGEGLETVPNLGARIEMVSWACDPKRPPLTGVNLNGTRILGADGYRIAIAPCVAPMIEQPITVPANVFSPIMKNLGDVKLGIADGHLLMMPDASTQIKAIIYAQAYPSIDHVLVRDQPDGITFNKTELLETIDQAMVFAGISRTPAMKLIIGKGELAVMMIDQDHNLFGNVIEIPDQAGHGRVQVSFTPKNIADALNGAPSESVSLYYNSEDMKKAFRLDGGSGYEAWIMPRRQGATDGEQ